MMSQLTRAFNVDRVPYINKIVFIWHKHIVILKICLQLGDIQKIQDLVIILIPYPSTLSPSIMFAAVRAKSKACLL